MRLFFLLLAGCAALTLCGGVPPEEDKKAVYEMFEAQDMRGQLDRIMLVMLENQLKEAPGMVKYLKELTVFYRKNSGYDAIREDLAGLYLRHFTVEEIREITRFYRSPVGKKMRDVSADVLVEANAIAVKRIEANVPAFLEEIRKKEAEAERK